MKYLICFLLMMNIGLHATEESVPPKEAWVVFATADYFDWKSLLQVFMNFLRAPSLPLGSMQTFPFRSKNIPV